MVIREKESETGTRGTKGTGLACGNATINFLGTWARQGLRGTVRGPGSRSSHEAGPPWGRRAPDPSLLRAAIAVSKQ